MPYGIVIQVLRVDTVASYELFQVAVIVDVMCYGVLEVYLSYCLVWIYAVSGQARSHRLIAYMRRLCHVMNVESISILLLNTSFNPSVFYLARLDTCAAKISLRHYGTGNTNLILRQIASVMRFSRHNKPIFYDVVKNHAFRHFLKDVQHLMTLRDSRIVMNSARCCLIFLAGRPKRFFRTVEAIGR